MLCSRKLNNYYFFNHPECITSKNIFIIRITIKMTDLVKLSHVISDQPGASYPENPAVDASSDKDQISSANGKEDSKQDTEERPDSSLKDDFLDKVASMKLMLWLWKYTSHLQTIVPHKYDLELFLNRFLFTGLFAIYIYFKIQYIFANVCQYLCLSGLDANHYGTLYKRTRKFNKGNILWWMPWTH